MAAAHDFSTWPRRKEAAKRIGKSVAQLRRYEGKRINPIKDKNGENRFDPEELDKLAAHLRKSGTRKAAAKAKSPRTDAPRATRDAAPPEPRVSGAVTKRAFEMFEQNYSRARVAIELEESVENVNWLHENYLVMSGKMDAAAAQRAVRGDAVAGGPKPQRPSEPIMEAIDEKALRARPLASLNASDLEMLRWIDELDAEKADYERTREAVLTERRAAAPGEVIESVDAVELRARPRESLTLAEREYVDFRDTLARKRR